MKLKIYRGVDNYEPFTISTAPLYRGSDAIRIFTPASQKNWAGPNIWIKRDDMLGLAGGGNKTRKLEFLVADALSQGADTLITCGAVQSNHARLTLAAACKEGMACHLVIEERVPGSYKTEATGNNFLFHLMGAASYTVVPGGSDMMGRNGKGR